LRYARGSAVRSFPNVQSLKRGDLCGRRIDAGAVAIGFFATPV